MARPVESEHIPAALNTPGCADGPCNKPDSITTVTASGDSNYEFGFNVGRATALQIAARMATSQFQTISAFAQTPPGAQVVDILSANVNFTFPQFIEEAQGLADGAGALFPR